MTEFQILVVAAAFIVAGIAKGAIGIGLPPIAVGIMTLAVPLDDALAIMAIPTLTTNVWQAIYGRGLLRLFRRFWTLALTATIALVVVAATLGKLGSAQASAWLGVMLVVYSTIALLATAGLDTLAIRAPSHPVAPAAPWPASPASPPCRSSPTCSRSTSTRTTSSRRWASCSSS
jgi:hypothetical protein